MPTEFFVFSSYSTHSFSVKLTFSNILPLSSHFTIQPSVGENSTGSTPRQSNVTIVLKFPWSSFVYFPINN